MTEEADMCIEMAEESMKASIKHLESELHKIRAGKANPTMLDGISIENYGSQMPLSQIANISTPDPRTLVIQPWDKANLVLIEKEITNSNLGLNPQNDGTIIRLNVPVLTEERRMGLIKQSKAEAEHAKVGIRNARKDANQEANQLEKDGLSEDMTKKLVDKVQDLTNKYTALVDKTFEAKETDISSI
ncbi:MAG: ribosome recycling factor [Bacteroidetes bacterium 4572_112]|nr:MAG: ribosome recycling factor [Bacteroidetes bacterium 4572_112]